MAIDASAGMPTTPAPIRAGPIPIPIPIPMYIGIGMTERFRSRTRTARLRTASISVALIAFLASSAPNPAQAPTPAREERPAPGSQNPARRPPTTQPTATQPAAKKVDPRALYWSRVLFLTLVLLVILVFSTLAIIVFSRRYRAYLARGRRTPTPSDDVWTMHKLPPDAQVEPGPDELNEDAGDDRRDRPT